MTEVFQEGITTYGQCASHCIGTPGCKSFNWDHNGSDSKCSLLSSGWVPNWNSQSFNWGSDPNYALTVILNSSKVSDCKMEMLTNKVQYGNGLIEFEQKMFCSKSGQCNNINICTIRHFFTLNILGYQNLNFSLLISFPVRFRNTVISKRYFRFWLIPSKDAESNFRGGS